MSQELCCSCTNDLVVPLVGSSKLEDDSSDDQESHVRKFYIDDRHQGRINVCEVRRSHLGLDDCSADKTDASTQVFVQQFDDNILNVRNIDLVDYLINTLS